MEQIKCPCCGGLTTNYLNCDYCGSYLVRFSKRNIEYDDTQLGKDAKVILGIQEELQANIDEQINTQAKNHICSKTTTGKFAIEVRNPRSIGDIVKNSFGDTIHTVNPKNPFDENEIAIILVIRVFEFSKSYLKGLSTDDKLRQLDEKQKRDWLKHAGLLDLCATCEDPLSSIDGSKGICYSYYLNFGQDVTGATRAISSFLFGVSQANIEKVSFTRSSLSEIQYQANVRKIKDEKKSEFKIELIAGLCFYIVIFIYCLIRTDFKKEGLFITAIISAVYFLYIAYIYIKHYFQKS